MMIWDVADDQIPQSDSISLANFSEKESQRAFGLQFPEIVWCQHVAFFVALHDHYHYSGASI